MPDVVGSALSKAGAFVQTQVNQVQTLQGALLGDLALEHQLRERTRYARTLAESLGYYQLIPVFERLDVAHTATIEWLEARLTEVGRTGTSALQATPVQALVGATRKVALLPFGVFAGDRQPRQQPAAQGRVDRRRHRHVRRRHRRRDGPRGRADRRPHRRRGRRDDRRHGHRRRLDAAGAVAEGAATVAGTVAEGAQSRGARRVSRRPRSSRRRGRRLRGADRREATSQAAETTGEAVEGAARATEQATQTEVEQVLDLTDVDEDKPPFAGYASLSGDSVMRHVRDTEDVEHLREILAFEQAHKNRKGVVGALNERLTELAGASA